MEQLALRRDAEPLGNALRTLLQGSLGLRAKCFSFARRRPGKERPQRLPRRQYMSQVKAASDIVERVPWYVCPHHLAGRIEYECIRIGPANLPTLVMLHEGLGSVSMWKSLPQELAEATRANVVAYSRHGHGQSARVRQPREGGYMHREALEILPAFLDALGIHNPILFGHSDGGSIALIHAGASGRPVGGVIALAPHVMVEDISISSIAAAKVAYQATDLRE